MKLRRNKFTTFMLLAYAWLCCCGMDFCVDMDLSYIEQSIEAFAPSGVDSLEMRVMFKDSLLAQVYDWPEKDSVGANFFYRDACDSVPKNKVCSLDVTISFYCGDKKVELPTYTVRFQMANWGDVDQVYYAFAEYDERKISGNYSIEAFLAPEDTSCGKFVNYAVLKEQ